MSFIDWGDEFAIDVEEIDEQHRQLFELMNDLYEAMRDGEGSEEVAETLEGLEEYVGYHFSSERDLAVDCGFSSDCTGCHESHQQAHAEFAERVSELREMHEQGDATVHMKTLRFLRTWLTDHVKGMDQQLGDYINEEASPDELEPMEMDVSMD